MPADPKDESPRDAREIYAREALPLVARILQVLDRDPLSPTAGSFDRQYWHYRTMDFPSGMSQEFVLPVALAYALPIPGSPFHGRERLREWALSGVDFARRSAHRDASCDDYHPFERALGAVAFSLHACAEAMLILDARDEALVEFLVRRARWLSRHGESGVLTNHHAIAAAALQAVGRLSGVTEFREAARRKAEEVLEHQHEEGWYREYEGFDPGYQTVTVDFLARYWKSSGDESVMPSLEKALHLLEQVQHPDGTFGGEYGSRNTYHCQPHGFELLAPRIPAAGRIADRHLRCLARGARPLNDDDRLMGHAAYPLLLAWRDHQPRQPSPEQTADQSTLLPGCGFLIERRSPLFVVAGLAKGGPFRAYQGDDLLANDSGVALRTTKGQVLVSHLSHEASFERLSKNEIITRGVFHESTRELMTTSKAVILRLFMMTVGRFARTLVRKLLQRRLILNRKPAPFAYERRFLFEEEGLLIRDVIRARKGAPALDRILLGVGQTSVYIAASQPWEKGWLLTPLDLSPEAERLAREGEIVHERILSTGRP